jgi:hypothetical protein
MTEKGPNIKNFCFLYFSVWNINLEFSKILVLVRFQKVSNILIFLIRGWIFYPEAKFLGHSGRNFFAKSWQRWALARICIATESHVLEWWSQHFSSWENEWPRLLALTHVGSWVIQLWPCFLTPVLVEA